MHIHQNTGLVGDVRTALAEDGKWKGREGVSKGLMR